MAESVGTDYVARTVRVLEVLAERPCSPPEIGRELRIADRTARRMLNRLVEEGYVETIGGGWHRYRLAPTSFVLGLRLVQAGTDRASRPPIAPVRSR